MAQVPHSSSASAAGKEWLGNAWIRLAEAIRIGRDESSNHLLIETECRTHLLLVACGYQGSIVIDGRLHAISSDKALAAAPGQRVEMHQSFAEEQAPLYAFYFEVKPAPGDETNPLAAKAILEPGKGGALAAVRLQAACEKIYSHWNTGDAIDRLAGHAGFLELLHLLMRKPGQHEDALERTRSHMQRHYGENLTVEFLAEAAGMSRFHFMRSFKERFGQSAMDYLAEVRMNHSKRMLEEGRALKDIAEEAGYKDPLYFSSQFKKQVGLAPTRYVANRKSKVAAYSWPNIGHLLTLQIIPYAAPIDQFWNDDYRKKFGFDVKVPLSHDYDFNSEALRRARPDKILALEEMMPEEEKAKLRAIAPVLFLPWHEGDWREHLRMTARFLEREAQAERWLDDYERKAAAARGAVPDCFAKRAALMLTVTSRGICVWGRRVASALYEDLGLRSAYGVDAIAFTEEAEIADLAAYDADMFVVHIMRDPQSQSAWEHLRSSEQWNRLRAVREGAVLFASGQAWCGEPVLEYTANRQELLLQELDSLFRAHRDGKPGTIAYSFPR